VDTGGNLQQIFLPAQEYTPGQGWKVGQQLQNAGTDDTIVELLAYSREGNSFNCGSKVIGPRESANYQSYAECGGAPWVIGSGVFNTSQPSVAIANISNWGTGGAGGQYRGTDVDDASTSLFFPLVKHDHYGRTTTFHIQNASSLSNNIQVVFQVRGKNYERIFSMVNPYASIVVNPGDAGVPAGNHQVGSLTVTGSQKIAGVSTEHEHGVAVASNLQASGGFTPGDYDSQLYCPLFRNAHLSVRQTTGAQVQNVTDQAQDVEFIYTPGNGGSSVRVVRTIGAGASETFYAPAIGIPENSVGSVTIRGEGNIAAVVNDHGVENGHETTTTYSCFARKNLSGVVLLPLYKEFYLSNTTGIQVQNADETGRAATITATYYPMNGSAPVIIVHKPVPAGRSLTFWGVSRSTLPAEFTVVSGNPALLYGTYGSVVVTSDTPIAVIANESLFGESATEVDAKNYEGFNLTYAP
jgi:hypothetical protein